MPGFGVASFRSSSREYIPRNLDRKRTNDYGIAGSSLSTIGGVAAGLATASAIPGLQWLAPFALALGLGGAGASIAGAGLSGHAQSEEFRQKQAEQANREAYFRAQDEARRKDAEQPTRTDPGQSSEVLFSSSGRRGGQLNDPGETGYKLGS